MVRRDRLPPGGTTRIGDVGCTTALRIACDLGRQEDLVCTRLVDRGWRIYRCTAYDVYVRPGRLAAELAPPSAPRDRGGGPSRRRVVALGPAATAMTRP